MNNENIFSGIEEYLQSPNLTREEKLKLINEVGENYRRQVQKEYEHYRNMQILAGALEIGSAAIPVGGVAGAVGKKLVPKLIPYAQPILKQVFTKNVRQKIINDWANGVFVKAPEFLHNRFGHKIPDDIFKNTISGMADGAVYGLGESLEKETNPFKTMAQNAISNGILGGTVSGVTANIAKHVQGNNLKLTTPLENMTQNEITQYRKQAREYYNNYLRDIIIGNKDLGLVKFGKKGGQETISKALHNAQYFPKLKQQIQNGQFTKITNDHLRKDNFEEFYHLKNKLNSNGQQKSFDYEIGKRSNGDLEYYLTKDITGSRAENIVPVTTGKSPSLGSAHPIQTRALEPKSSNIINDSVKNFNPPLWQIEQGASTINATTHSKQQNPPNNEAIKQTSPSSFEVSVEQDKYLDYKNPLTNDTKIYSAEGIGEMTTKEFTEAEPEIRAQWGSIGIPRRNELANAVNNGTLLFIDSYVRGDGTPVKAHYRARRKRF